MSNKQPYYHRAVVLFTATEEMDRDAVTHLLRNAVAKLPKKARGALLIHTVECEEVDNEPGDPADLVE